MDFITDQIAHLTQKYKIDLEQAVVIYYARFLHHYFVQCTRQDSRTIVRFTKIINKQLDFDLGTYLDEFIDFSDLDALIHRNGDPIGTFYNRTMDRHLRKVFGKFYTPNPLVKHLFDSIGFDEISGGRLIDLACGSGAFLIEATNRIIDRREDIDPQIVIHDIIDRVHGADIDAYACDLARLNLLFYTFPLWKKVKNYRPSRFNVFNQNVLTLPTSWNQINKQYQFIVGNPPYVEAKKLPHADKVVCRENFPQLTGAFDLYMAFLDLALQLVTADGSIGFVLPSKFLVAKYARDYRSRIMNEFAIGEITDISNLKYFDADVYPILFVLKKTTDESTTRTICNIASQQDFEQKRINYVCLKQDTYRHLRSPLPFYVFENEIDREIIEHVLQFQQKTLGDYLQIKTTVSFHEKGLREQYIKLNTNGSSSAWYPYLGGKSYSRKNEVSAYQVNWTGYYINYAADELRQRGNPLPPLKNFLQPKIIFSQHARRMHAYPDNSGRWITKDVFPIAFLTDPSSSSHRINYYTGYLNSEVFSYLYAIFYRGIQVADGYLHFLPIFMSAMPCPEENDGLVATISQLVHEIIKTPDFQTLGLAKINDEFYRAFDLRSKQVNRIRAFAQSHLT